MAREKIHGRHRRVGCNCDEGKAAHAAYMRELRASKRAEKNEQEKEKPQLRLVENSPVVERINSEAPASPARSVTVQSDEQLGRTGLAVLRQISHMLPDAAAEDEHAAEIALAVALAATVDRRDTEVKDRTSAARELRALLNGMKPTAPPAARQESAQELLLRRLAEPLSAGG